MQTIGYYQSSVVTILFSYFSTISETRGYKGRQRSGDGSEMAGEKTIELHRKTEEQTKEHEQPGNERKNTRKKAASS